MLNVRKIYNKFAPRNTMDLKAAIFDLDGTLVYTLPKYRQMVVTGVLAELGITEYPLGFIDQFWFYGNRSQRIREELGIEPESFFQLWESHDTKERRETHTRMFDDVDYLHKLKERGYRLGVVTGGSPHVKDVNVNLLGNQLFDAVVCANPFALPLFRSKPDPAGLLYCLQQLGVSPAEALYVGNGDEDVLAAQNAGVLDVLILRGEHEPPKVNASLRIQKLYELDALFCSDLDLLK